MVPELINAALAASMSASAIAVDAVAPEMLVGAPAAADAVEPPAADSAAEVDVLLVLLEPHAASTRAPAAVAAISAARMLSRERSFKITPCER